MSAEQMTVHLTQADVRRIVGEVLDERTHAQLLRMAKVRPVQHADMLAVRDPRSWLDALDAVKPTEGV